MGRKKPYNRRQWADESERCQEGSSKEKYDERKVADWSWKNGTPHEADKMYLTAGDMHRLFLSPQIQEGLIITVYSIVHLAKNQLQEPNVVVILSERVYKDPLEELYFSRQHAASGWSNNPTYVFMV